MLSMAWFPYITRGHTKFVQLQHVLYVWVESLHVTKKIPREVMCNFLKVECSGCDHDADNYSETRQGQAHIFCSTTPWNNPSNTYSSMQHHQLPPIFLSIAGTPLLTCYYQYSNMRRHSACTRKAQSSEYNVLDHTLRHTILYIGKGVKFGVFGKRTTVRHILTCQNEYGA